MSAASSTSFSPGTLISRVSRYSFHQGSSSASSNVFLVMMPTKTAIDKELTTQTSLKRYLQELGVNYSQTATEEENVEVYKQGFFVMISALMFTFVLSTFTLYKLKERLKKRKIELDKLKLKLDEYETGAK